MRRNRSLTDRNKDREEALAKQRALIERMARLRQSKPKRTEPRVPGVTATVAMELPPCASEAVEHPAPQEHLIEPQLSLANGGAVIKLQPWAVELVSTLLERAKDRKTSIRLLWPAEIDTLVGLHAVASLSRALQSDLGGLRTIFYPGTHATWTALDRLTISRLQLRELWRKTYETAPRRKSESFQAVLAACNDVELFTKDASQPQLRQLIPAFIYEAASSQWADTKHSPLDRLVSKVVKLRMREILRKQINPEWRNAALAPGALLVLPRGIKRKEVKQAMAPGARTTAVKSDVLLIDARERSAVADSNALRRLPDFLKTVYETCGSQIGALIVTDDPTEYFVLRHRLEQASIQSDSAILAGESEPHEWLASRAPRPADWRPNDRSLINFSVSILDQQAAGLARRFGRIAEAVREQGIKVEEPFRLAQGFVMRASHLPGGFLDLRSGEAGEREYLSRDLEWSRIEGLIRDGLIEGGATEQRKQIDDALVRVHKHLADCENATPLALKLKEQVQRFAVDSRDGLTIILSSPRNIAVAQRFLARTLGAAWTSAQSRVDWLTLAQAPTELNARASHGRLAIVGLSPRILRLLATHTEIPTGTCLLVPAQRALGVTQTLKGLVEAGALKPYRARLSGLLTTLNNRLREIPDIDILTRSFDSTLLSPPRTSLSSPAPDPKSYRFCLEDGRYVNASGTVFLYEGLEGEEFRRVQVRSIEPGDCIFEMSDELRDEIEEALTPGHGAIEASPSRKMLALYHDFVRSAVAELFSAQSRQASIRAIKARMIELHPGSTDISLGKLSYWISLKDDDDAPHGARDHEEFLFFCRALNIDVDLAKRFWERIRRVRFENQTEGRQLNAIYSEILFNPESAQVYRGVSPEVIRRLQGKALDCVFHVTEVEAPGP
jgi:hypothetical protein